MGSEERNLDLKGATVYFEGEEIGVVDAQISSIHIVGEKDERNIKI